MKILSLLFLVFLFSCYSKKESKTKFVHQKSDSIWTTVQYAFDWKRNNYPTVTARKIYKDSLEPAFIDPVTKVILRDSVWVRDTIYLVPILDTLRDGKNQPIPDSLNGKPTGKARMVYYWPVLPKEFLLKDYNRNWK